MKKLQTLALALALVALGVFSGMSHAQRPSPKTSCEDDIKSGQLTITAPIASGITATSANLTGSVSVASILPGCTYTAKLVWGPVPTPPFPNTSAAGSIPPSPLNLTGTASLLNPGSGYGARIEVTKQCLGLAPTVCNGPIRFFKTLPGEGHGKAKICVWKFEDKNGNGKQEKGELALPGWKFEIKDANGNIVATITTGGPTQTCADVPAPGTYTVTEQPVQAGWTSTTPNPQTVTVSPGQTVNLRFGNNKKIDGRCDLEIKKTISPNPLVIGQPATVTIKVANVGNAPCQGVTTMTDGPLAWLMVSSVAQGGSLWNCSTTPPNPGATVKCTWDAGIQPVPPGPLPTITITGTVTAKPGSSVTNCATVNNANDTNPANNKDCIEVPVQPPTTKLPDLIIKKRVSCPGPATAQGNKCTITFTITNNGPGTFNGILKVQDVVTPSPSPGLSMATNPVGWNCSIGPPNTANCASTGPVTLVPPGSTTFSVDVYVPTGQYKNCASVKGVKGLQFPFSSTPVQEVNMNNNTDCIGFVSGRPRVVGEGVPVQMCNDITMNLSTGVANWSVTPGSVHSTSSGFGWVSIAGATWIQPANSSTLYFPGGDYQYKVLFNLLDPGLYGSIKIIGQYAADNSVTNVSMNGGPSISSCGPDCFGSSTAFTIPQGFIFGPNHLDVTVHNRAESTGGPTPTGLIVKAELQAICKK